jgi:hypothetical protein
VIYRRPLVGSVRGVEPGHQAGQIAEETSGGQSEVDRQAGDGAEWNNCRTGHGSYLMVGPDRRRRSSLSAKVLADGDLGP